MNPMRLALVASLFAIAAVACDNKPAETPTGPGPMNSADLPGGPINTGGAPNTDAGAMPGGPVNTGGGPSKK